MKQLYNIPFFQMQGMAGSCATMESQRYWNTFGWIPFKQNVEAKVSVTGKVRFFRFPLDQWHTTSQKVYVHPVGGKRVLLQLNPTNADSWFEYTCWIRAWVDYARVRSLCRACSLLYYLPSKITLLDACIRSKHHQGMHSFSELQEG